MDRAYSNKKPQLPEPAREWQWVAYTYIYPSIVHAVNARVCVYGTATSFVDVEPSLYSAVFYWPVAPLLASASCMPAECWQRVVVGREKIGWTVGLSGSAVPASISLHLRRRSIIDRLLSASAAAIDVASHRPSLWLSRQPPPQPTVTSISLMPTGKGLFSQYSTVLFCKKIVADFLTRQTNT